METSAVQALCIRKMEICHKQAAGLPHSVLTKSGSAGCPCLCAVCFEGVEGLRRAVPEGCICMDRVAHVWGCVLQNGMTGSVMPFDPDPWSQAKFE